MERGLLDVGGVDLVLGGGAMTPGAMLAVLDEFEAHVKARGYVTTTLGDFRAWLAKRAVDPSDTEHEGQQKK